MQPTEYRPDSYQLLSLKTWYKPDDPRYLDPRHPLIKLAGEAGELTDLYGKEEYKPNFSWWNCKHCGYGDASHDSYRRCPHLSKDENIMRGVYTPLVLDELGDYAYYLRILMWQSRLSFEQATLGYEPTDFSHSLERYLCDLNLHSAKQYDYWLRSGKISKGRYQRMIFAFMAILSKLDCTLDRLTELNYTKLNSEPSAHGWKNV